MARPSKFKDPVLKLLAKGERSPQDIAKAIGCTAQYVRVIMKAEGLSSDKRKKKATKALAKAAKTVAKSAKKAKKKVAKATTKKVVKTAKKKTSKKKMARKVRKPTALPSNVSYSSGGPSPRITFKCVGSGTVLRPDGTLIVTATYSPA